MRSAEIPLAAYIHWPWCLAKCPYCDFNSHPVPGADRRDSARGAYVEALLLDLQAQQHLGAERSVQTVFLGGGTPSLFNPREVGRVLEALRENFQLAPHAEITMEVNPGALERGSLEGYRAAGVNRLSFGAQSFDADTLKRLGRLHSPDETRAAVLQAKAAGFSRINIDVMHGLPGQSVALAAADVRAALALEVDHISYYQLTLEPNTRFHAFPPELPDESTLADIADTGAARLSDAGYHRYEVSAWAQPGAECRHNLNYWLFGDYLAFGAGAHGKLTDNTGVKRYLRPMHPRSFVSQVQQPIELEPVERRSVAFEFLLNALRLTEGFNESDFESRTGLKFAEVLSRVDAAREDGLLSVDRAGLWAPTQLGRRFLNDLQARFLP